MDIEDANTRDQVIIIASLGPIGCPVKTVEINSTNSGFFFQHVNASIHQGLMFMKQRDSPGHGLPGELLEQSRVKDANDLNKEKKLRFRRNPGGREWRDENKSHNAASPRCV